MTLPRSEILSGVESNLREMREGPRPIRSAFRLRCAECGNLVDRGMNAGDSCPFYVARGVKCTGTLQANPNYKAMKPSLPNRCDCGRLATIKKHGEWLCERCYRIQKEYEAARAARNGYGLNGGANQYVVKRMVGK